ncbi:large ribosomal subunit protein uL3m isoform X2 [Procambarus clarkii]|uniref:large ribosomal subunit protein uL3m isoform X2 n=1 Tax=Procambarus clarkii TaxID=6728 RepID=UPI0037438934
MVSLCSSKIIMLGKHMINLSSIRLTAPAVLPLWTTQVRCMSRVKRRHTVPPFWLPKATRVMYPEELTSENEAFVSEVIADQYSSPLKTDPWERGVWTPKSLRCGVIARKLGIYPLWTKDGTRHLTTLLQVSKEYFNMFSDAGILPKKKISKFIITPDAKLAPGTPLYASHFKPGHYVDVAGITIDRGFQGVMKRWGFHGMPASHGVTKSHRRGGNIGSGGEKARVLPGQKMPGHMGRERRILKALKIWRINTHYNVMWVQGPAVPGATGSYVFIYDTIIPTRRHTTENPPPFPTFFQDEQEIEEELYDEMLHVFSQPSISFAEK